MHEWLFFSSYYYYYLIQLSGDIMTMYVEYVYKKVIKGLKTMKVHTSVDNDCCYIWIICNWHAYSNHTYLRRKWYFNLKTNGFNGGGMSYPINIGVWIVFYGKLLRYDRDRTKINVVKSLGFLHQLTILWISTNELHDQSYPKQNEVSVDFHMNS